jgi:hypothetical protein
MRFAKHVVFGCQLTADITWGTCLYRHALPELEIRAFVWAISRTGEATKTKSLEEQ